MVPSIVVANNNEHASIGININRISDRSTQFPFLDFTKQARTWVSKKEDSGSVWNDDRKLELDENGWVRLLKKNQIAELIFLSSIEKHIPFTKYIVRYKGKGKIRYVKSATKISDHTEKNRDLIYVNHDDSNGYAALQIIETDPSDYIRDITIVPEKYIGLYDQGEIFNPDWLDFIDDFRAIRFMNWMKTTDSTQELWENRPKVDNYTWSSQGVPLETMIALANKTNTSPWFNMPHLATNNYIRQFAGIVKQQLKKTLRIYVEYSNEVWNGWFGQSKYATEMGRNRWQNSIEPAMQWYGMRTAEMCDIWKMEVFGKDATRVQCVLSTQTGNVKRILPSLECPDWVNEGNKACYKHGIDSIVITGYFSGCLNGESELSGNNADLIRSWFKEKDAGLKKAFEQLENGKYFECEDTLEAKEKIYAHYFKIAKKKGLSIIAYEGGQHITALGSNVSDDIDFINFHLAINRDPRIKTLYLKNLAIWKQKGGTLFMHYHDISRPGPYGSWGALEYLGQDTSYKLEALRKFNSEQKCWWEFCE